MRTMRRFLVSLAALTLPIVVVGVAVAIPDGACDPPFDPKWEKHCAPDEPTTTTTTIVPPPPHEWGRVTGYHMYGFWKWDSPQAERVGNEELHIQAYDGEFVIGDAAAGTIDQLITIFWLGHAPVGPNPHNACSVDGPVAVWTLNGSVFTGGSGDPVVTFDPDVDADTAFVDGVIPVTGWTWTMECLDGERVSSTEAIPVAGELSVAGSFGLEACRTRGNRPLEWKVLTFEGSVEWTEGFDSTDHAAGFDGSLIYTPTQYPLPDGTTGILEWGFREVADYTADWPGCWICG